MFLIDKYIPKTIDEIFFHQDIYDMLKIMAEDKSMPHLIFYGRKGVGKKTMVNMFMHMLFGDSIRNTRKVVYNVSSSCNNDDKIQEFTQSFHHILIEPSGNNHDRYLIHDIIKLYLSKIGYNVIKSRYKFKLIVINNVDIMSESVQFSLRRTIEQYSKDCRFIMIADSISKIVEPLSSRCKCIGIKSPDLVDIIDYSLNIAYKENITLSLDQLAYIIQEYKGDIKNVLWRLELYKLNEIYIDEIINLFKEIQDNLKLLNKEFNYDKYSNDIKFYNKDNKFLYKNIDKYINKISEELYNDILNNINQYLSDNMINMYFENCNKFLNNINKSNFKKIHYKNSDKKLKIDIIIFNIRISFQQILLHIKLLDPVLSRDKLLNTMYKLIKKCDFKYINDIRNIIFNLLITNIKGTEIVKLLLNIIINDEKIYQNKKIKIIELAKDIEYGIIKGRREINQFDNLIISIINILTSN
jgi:DNA polymerase III delta prime subunit